jgi:hypothetical protein
MMKGVSKEECIKQNALNCNKKHKDIKNYKQNTRTKITIKRKD